MQRILNEHGIELVILPVTLRETAEGNDATPAVA